MGIDPDVQPFLDELAVKATTATALATDAAAGAAKATAATAVLATRGEGAGRHRRGLRRPQHPRPEGYAGHNTHGLTVGYVDGAQLRDLRVVGVKGSGSSPPAETFALEVWQALNVTVDDCTIDGQNVSATLFGGPQNNAVVKIGDYWNG